MSIFKTSGLFCLLGCFPARFAKYLLELGHKLADGLLPLARLLEMFFRVLVLVSLKAFQRGEQLVVRRVIAIASCDGDGFVKDQFNGGKSGFPASCRCQLSLHFIKLSLMQIANRYHTNVLMPAWW